jgi:hypothetical protein
MKSRFFILMLAMVLAVGFASAVTPIYYDRPCGTNIDICTWDKILPLGSPDTYSCGLSYNTFWDLNTQTSATCTFNGNGLENTQLHVSIDNDVIKCTLNGNTIFENYQHEGCAPADPRDVNGYSLSITPQPGQNSLICTVSDRGSMSHFDACVTADENEVPEFSSITAGIALAASGIGFLILRRKK